MHSFLYALTSSNIDWFSKLFHCQNQEKICSNNVTKDPTTRKVIVTSCRSSAGILHGCLGRTARRHTLPGTLWRTCGVRTSRSSSLTCGPQTARIESSRLHCLGCPSTDGLSPSTIHDNQPAEAGNRHWVGQTIAAFYRSRHWSVSSPVEWVVPQQGEQIEHLM